MISKKHKKGNAAFLKKNPSGHGEVGYIVVYLLLEKSIGPEK